MQCCRRLFLLPLLLLFVAPCHAQYSRAQIEARSIHFVSCAAHDSNTSGRLFGWGQGTVGARTLVHDSKELLANTKCRQIWFHNYWGRDNAAEDMEWDQRARLIEDSRTRPALRKLDDDFINDWAPFLRGDHSNGERVTLHFYIGVCHQGSTMMVPLEKNPTSWYMRWWTSVSKIVELASKHPGQVWLWVDSTYNLPADHPHHEGLKMLRQMNIPIGVEIRPRANCPHLHGFNCVEQWAHNRYTGLSASPFDPIYNLSSPGAKNHQITGMRVALLPYADQVNTRNISNVMRQGVTPLYWLPFYK